jgi:hypothetical protein
MSGINKETEAKSLARAVRQHVSYGTDKFFDKFDARISFKGKWLLVNFHQSESGFNLNLSPVNNEDTEFVGVLAIAQSKLLAELNDK